MEIGSYTSSLAASETRSRNTLREILQKLHTARFLTVRHNDLAVEELYKELRLAQRLGLSEAKSLDEGTPIDELMKIFCPNGYGN